METGELIEKAGTQQIVGGVTGVVLKIGDRLEDSEWQSERSAQTRKHDAKLSEQPPDLIGLRGARMNKALTGTM